MKASDSVAHPTTASPPPDSPNPGLPPVPDPADGGGRRGTGRRGGRRPGPRLTGRHDDRDLGGWPARPVLPAPGPGPFPAVIVLSGSSGGVTLRRPKVFAAEGYAVLSLPYFNYTSPIDGTQLPSATVELPLEYFGTAIDWLQAQPARRPRPDRDLRHVARRPGRDARRRRYPAIKSVIAIAPPTVTWDGGTGKSSFSFKGKSVPYVVPFGLEAMAQPFRDAVAARQDSGRPSRASLRARRRILRSRRRSSPSRRSRAPCSSSRAPRTPSCRAWCTASCRWTGSRRTTSPFPTGTSSARAQVTSSTSPTSIGLSRSRRGRRPGRERAGRGGDVARRAGVPRRHEVARSAMEQTGRSAHCRRHGCGNRRSTASFPAMSDPSRPADAPPSSAASRTPVEGAPLHPAQRDLFPGLGHLAAGRWKWALLLGGPFLVALVALVVVARDDATPRRSPPGCSTRRSWRRCSSSRPSSSAGACSRVGGDRLVTPFSRRPRPSPRSRCRSRSSSGRSWSSPG